VRVAIIARSFSARAAGNALSARSLSLVPHPHAGAKKAATSANDIPPRSDAIKKSKSVFSHDLPSFVSKCIEGGKRG
jgi:hypothetical protein